MTAQSTVTDMCANIGYVWPRFTAIQREAYDYFVTSMLLVTSKPQDFQWIHEVTRAIQDHAVPEGSILGVTVGIHPCSAKTWTPAVHNQMIQMCQVPESPVRIVGECGLDYFRARSEGDCKKQRTVFSKQVEMAVNLDMPLFVHERSAHDDTLAILDNAHRAVTHAGRVFYVLVHCFTVEHDEDVADAKKRLDAYLERGYFIGIATAVCCDDDRARKLRSVLAQTGFERMKRALVVETDAPHMAPPSAPSITDPKTGRRHRQNSPAFTMEAAIRLADLWHKDLNVVAEATEINARRFANNHRLLHEGVLSSEIDW